MPYRTTVDQPDSIVAELRSRLEATRVIETHISWVLLTGGEAWKIKKPVDLGFVDFTTLQRREFFCREELRLNRRLAPALYLDVTPIAGTPDDPRPGGEGDPIEFAVRMREFPQEALLARVLQRGELTAAHIDGLAEQIADFHGRIETAADDTPFGTPERVRSPVEENFRHLLRAADVVPAVSGHRRRLQRLRERSLAEWERLRDRFARRKREGFVRECHGDMHLGNMILDDGRTVIFDCIEFNSDLRWIDVASEIAFTAMDLEDRGRPEFARRLLDGWLAATGDYAAVALLPFYAAYRAVVRAKVACLQMEQSENSGDTEPSGTSGLRDDLDSYLSLAESSLEPRNRFLLITHGPSGSGKTTASQGVVEELGAIRIRSDVERKRLCGLGPLDASGSAVAGGIYTEDVTDRTYARLEQLARSILDAGFPVVVDATFLQRRRRDAFRRLAASAAAPYFIANLKFEPDELRSRIAERRRRGHDASEAGPEVLERQLANTEPLAADESADVLTIEAAASDRAAALARALRTGPKEPGRAGPGRGKAAASDES